MQNGILYFIICFFIQIITNGAVIKGKVTDAETHEALYSVTISIPELKVGDVTGMDGTYSIRDLEPGHYILKASLIGYMTYLDSVIIADNEEAMELNIQLSSSVKWDSLTTPELEAYHKKIQNLNEEEPVLKIDIDSLVLKGSTFKAYLAMSNNIDDSLYVLKTYACFSVISAVVTDSSSGQIKSNRAMYDCLGEKICPDMSDLILIPPHSKIKYPVVDLWNYGFDRIPHGKYSIKIKYEYEKKEGINTFWCRSDSNIKALTTALRGSYVSSNTITFINE